MNLPTNRTLPRARRGLFRQVPLTRGTFLHMQARYIASSEARIVLEHEAFYGGAKGNTTSRMSVPGLGMLRNKECILVCNESVAVYETTSMTGGQQCPRGKAYRTFYGRTSKRLLPAIESAGPDTHAQVSLSDLTVATCPFHFRPL